MDQRGQLVPRDPLVGRVRLGETARWVREDVLAPQAPLVQWDRAAFREPIVVRVRLARRGRPVLRVQPAPQEPWDPQVRLVRPVLLVLPVAPPARQVPQVQRVRPARQAPQVQRVRPARQAPQVQRAQPARRARQVQRVRLAQPVPPAHEGQQGRMEQQVRLQLVPSRQVIRARRLQ